jgi:hypothetical protein
LGDFPTELARDCRASESGAKPFVVRRGGDGGSAALRPCEDIGLAVFRADDLDLPIWRGECSIFCGVCPEFVQQKRYTRDRRTGNAEVRSSDRNRLALSILNVLVRSDDCTNERMQRRWLCVLRIVSAAARQRMRPSESR